MEIIKNYLTAGEIRNIGDNVLNFKNPMDREYIKTLLIADFCTDVKLIKDEEDETKITFSEDIYNNLIVSGDYDKLYSEIKNISMVDKYISESESLINLIITLYSDLKESINNNNIIEDFNETINQVVKQQIGSDIVGN